MKREIVFREVSADGSVTIRNLNGFIGGKVKITIEKGSKRSLPQNAVLHWYINEIAEETGMSKGIIKEVLKKKFLTTDVLDINGVPICEEKTGEVLQYIKSTASLSISEFMEFTENVRIWAMDYLNLYLPLPNEEMELKFKY